MNELTITGISIRQDNQGRYCLNDLHKAAGGIPHHRPSKWLANKQAQDLISELTNETESGISEPEFGLRNPVVTTSVGAPTTYIVKELVYSYAMWISPAFNLRVIRAFDALVTGKFAKQDSLTAHAIEVLQLKDELIATQRKLIEVMERKRTRPVTEEEREQILAWHAEGLNQGEIRRRTGRSKGTISNLVRYGTSSGRVVVSETDVDSIDTHP